jgi:hypothetical protein
MKNTSKLLSVLTLFITACGGGGSSSISIDDLTAKTVHTICAYYATCGVVDTATSCESTYTLFGEGNVVAAVKAGTAKYDGSAAAACLDDEGKLDCGDLGINEQQALTKDCAKIFTGTIADNAACNVSEECISQTCTPTDSSCDPSAACCPGTCTPKTATVTVADGQDCSAAGSVCAGADVCVNDALGSTGTLCRAIAAEGGTCVNFGMCAEGTGCTVTVSGTTATGKCAKPLESGAACDPMGEAQCDADNLLYCDTTSSKCTALVQPGGACDATQNFNNGNCVPFSLCDSTSKCITQMPIGGTCDSTNNQSLDCTGYAECDPTTNKCIKTPDAHTCP